MDTSASNEVFEPPLRPFTRRDYHAMAAAGILGERDRVELINGRIIAMMPIGPWHCSSAARLDRLLHKAYQDSAIVTVGSALGLGEKSEPQPDLAVLRWQEDFYAEALPEAKDVLLLIEVADSSRVFDLGSKCDLYASEGIAEYWVVDGKRRCVHVFRDPIEGLFREKRLYQPGESIALPHCTGTELKVTDVGF